VSGHTPNNWMQLTKRDAMSTADLQLRDETELERIEHWRAGELERAGYDPSSAACLAAVHDVDLHRAIEMIESGCPPELALRILL